MLRNDDIRVVSSAIKIPLPSKRPTCPLRTAHSHIANATNSFAQLVNSFAFHSTEFTRSVLQKSSLFCSATLSLTGDRKRACPLRRLASLSLAEEAQQKARQNEERVLISEVLVRNKDGEEMERKDLEAEAVQALKACRPNSALTVREVQEDVHRIINSGYFSSCMPVAVDTRDGIRLVFQVEPNQEFQGLVCEGANVLPAKFLEDSMRDGYGKIINLRRLDEAISSINNWYMERGLFAMVSAVEILSGGILRLQVSEAEVNNISIRFLDRKTGEITVGKTKPETILRQITTKKGQVYSMLEGKRDVETVLTMGIMEDVSIIPQPADTGKVDLVMNVVERPSGGFSAGGGISSGITNGPLRGLIGSFAYSHRNVFGKNQKLNISLERGQVDSVYRINYTDPWIQGDDKRTSRTIMIQNSRTPGTIVHGNADGNGSLTIGRITGGIEFSRPIRPKWSGTVGLVFQHAGVRDEKGIPIIKDCFSSPLTASGNTHDQTLLAKLETVYTGSGDHGSSVFVLNMEKGLPLLPEWLSFTRVNARARKGVEIGPARLHLSISGGHVVGNFPPYEAFAIGGTNSVRGYEEGSVGSGRSYVVGSGEISFPVYGPVEGVIFSDYGTDLGSGPTVPGDPAGARKKPGSGYGYGFGIRVESPLGPLRLEYAFNDKKDRRFHFGVGHRN
ncbi:outer envelope protein 80, chloroplastic [Vigna radiata var. radiata]|uniref:Outer envelope protein 80, chloroplastic n=1 Tax=Vigna radiata var. radiata TaxID=3916 RepID=A0A1S3TWB4_VIGRR|nr:outer envelope protein 80, chloroplastic [Vigna radiata var. radiata]XP_014498072.1 outer envelope protein 80, chloroplastic [Vigna radiata var. radiata]XP_022635332.1 outer envelope protein 80, chloroplastic [Vigna radiata var. radiata]XP_022635333.1 outer envelope protein 80, chloroplastic [Vigna radiata var. radiata]